MRASSSAIPLIIYLVTISGFLLAASLTVTLRTMLGFLGDGTDVRGILIGGFLLALAFGHNFGGKVVTSDTTPVRTRLSHNFLATLIVQTIGLSLMSLSFLYVQLYTFGGSSRLLMTCLYTFLFMAPPAFLLGQTLPLSLRWAGGHDRRTTGRYLFWATLGAAAGALLPALVTLPAFGLSVTTLLLLALLVLTIGLLRRRLTVRTMLVPAIILLLAFVMNSNVILHSVGIVSQNAHNTVAVFTEGGHHKYLQLNGHPADQYDTQTGDTGGIGTKAQTLLLDPLKGQTRDILVLGNPGLTFGKADLTNRFTIVNDDADLKAIAEKDFIGEKLTLNKTFVTKGLRAFLSEAAASGKTYDLIYVDPLQGRVWLQDDLASQEFFSQLKAALKPDGVVAFTVFASPNFANEYSVALDATFRSVFPAANRIPVQDYDAWNRTDVLMSAYLYVGYAAAASGKVATDDRNSGVWNKPLKRDR